MAKKRKKREEEYHFKMPEFDEVEYMRKEVEGAKAAVATVVYAILVGLASYFLALAGIPAVAAPIGFAALYGMKYLFPAIRLDVKKFDRKAWVGNGAIFLFTWLAIWVLLLNPPFLDVSPPIIHEARIADGDVSLVPGTLAEVNLGPNATFELRVRVTDNAQVVKVTITVKGPSGSKTYNVTNPAARGGWYSLDVDAATSGLYTITIQAIDDNGRTSDSFVAQVRVTH